MLTSVLLYQLQMEISLEYRQIIIDYCKCMSSTKSEAQLFLHWSCKLWNLANMKSLHTKEKYYGVSFQNMFLLYKITMKYTYSRVSKMTIYFLLDLVKNNNYLYNTTVIQFLRSCT